MEGADTTRGDIILRGIGGETPVEKYARILSDKSRLFLILIFALNILALLGVLRLRIVTDPTALFGTSSPYEKNLEEIQKDFGIYDQLMVLLNVENAKSVEGISKILKVQKRLEDLESVRFVSGVPDFLSKGFGVEKLEKIDENTVEKILKFLDSFPVNPLGKNHAVLNVFLKSGSDPGKAVSEVERALEGIPHTITGSTYIEQKLFDYIIIVLFTIPPIAVFIILSIFSWRLGSFKAGAFSVAPAGMGALWSLGLMGWTTSNLSILNVLVPIFVIILGSADGLHFISHYLRSERGWKGVAESLKVVGVAMVMTSLTTMAGFFSFLTLPSDALRSLGFFSGIGIGLAAVATWIFLPAVLPRVSFKDVRPKELKIELSKKLALLSIVLVVSFIPGIFFLHEEFSLVDFYRPFTSVRKGFEEIRKLGYDLPIYASVELERPLSRDSAEFVLEVERGLERKGLAKHCISVYDILSSASEYLTGRREYPKFAPLLLAAMRGVQPGKIDSFMRGSSVLVVIFPGEDAEKLAAFLEEKGFKVGGIQLVLEDLNRGVVSAQVSSIALALSLVFSLLLVELRSFKLAVSSITPVSITLLILFGFMGYRSIPLNVTTVVMAAITIGVGIDYAIHYANLHRRFGRDEAMKLASGPIFANALGFALGYTSMLLSPLTIHVYLCQIMWVTMISSAFLTLTLLPLLTGD